MTPLWNYIIRQSEQSILRTAGTPTPGHRKPCWRNLRGVWRENPHTRVVINRLPCLFILRIKESDTNLPLKSDYPRTTEVPLSIVVLRLSQVSIKDTSGTC